jgi:hypothetical protein
LTDNIYTVMSGGLGDVLLDMLHPGADFGYFGALAAQGRKTKVFVWCHNDQALQLFDCRSFPTEIEFHFEMPGDLYIRTRATAAGSYRPLSAMDKGTLSWKRPDLTLSEEEAAAAKDIMAPGPFVVIHPFTSTTERSLYHNVDFIALLRAMCENGRSRIVLLGGTSKRALVAGQETQVEERVDFEHPLLVNLINKYTVRLHAYLASQAIKYIGGLGAFHCVAAEFGIPRLLYMSCWQERDVTEYSQDIYSMARSADVFYWGAASDSAEQRAIDFMRNQNVK